MCVRYTLKLVYKWTTASSQAMQPIDWQNSEVDKRVGGLNCKWRWNWVNGSESLLECIFYCLATRNGVCLGSLAAEEKWIYRYSTLQCCFGILQEIWTLGSLFGGYGEINIIIITLWKFVREVNYGHIYSQIICSLLFNSAKMFGGGKSLLPFPLFLSPGVYYFRIGNWIITGVF